MTMKMSADERKEFWRLQSLKYGTSPAASWTDKAAIDLEDEDSIGTRFVKSLMMRALSMRIDSSNPDMEWNRVCSHMPSWGDYGTQKLFVFTAA